MTQNDLLNKYEKHIPSGWYGFDGIPDEWCDDIDDLLSRMIEKIPDLEIHQIKTKFGGLRFYTNCHDPELNKEINELEDKCQNEKYRY